METFVKIMKISSEWKKNYLVASMNYAMNV